MGQAELAVGRPAENVNVLFFWAVRGVRVMYDDYSGNGQ